jgi:hypothetical protein
MFQTITCKGGHINLSYLNGETITAWSHGIFLGDHYKTVAGAKAAVTRAHRKFVAENERKHREFMKEVFG